MDPGIPAESPEYTLISLSEVLVVQQIAHGEAVPIPASIIETSHWIHKQVYAEREKNNVVVNYFFKGWIVFNELQKLKTCVVGRRLVK